MSNYEQVFDQATAGSGGGTATSQTIDVSRYTDLTLQIVGDVNTTDIDIDARAQTSPAAGLGVYEGTGYTAQDLTGDSNKSKCYVYDVTAVNEIEYTITNNGASNTTVDGYVTKTHI